MLRRPPTAEAGGQSRNRSRLAMAEMRADFDVHVSGPKGIDKVVTHSYVSTNRPARPLAAVFTAVFSTAA
jgi:hypothetical protein